MKKKINSSKKIKTRIRKKRRSKKNMLGISHIPRISVFKSIENIDVQAIDDYKSTTILALGTNSKHMKHLICNQNKSAQAYLIGKYFGKMLHRKGIKRMFFDRNGFKYTGRVANLVEGIKSTGLRL